MLLYRIVNKILREEKEIQKKFWQWFTVCYCKSIGVRFKDSKSAVFAGRPYLGISKSSNIQIGTDFVLNSGHGYGIETFSSKIYVAPGAALSIGDNVGMSSVVIGCQEKILIGNNVNIGGGSTIMDTNFHSLDSKLRSDRVNDHKGIKTAPVVIEDNVFVGTRCIICKGVAIGENSIIAAGSVVIKDIPANCVAGGNPCKVIKYLNA